MVHAQKFTIAHNMRGVAAIRQHECDRGAPLTALPHPALQPQASSSGQGSKQSKAGGGGRSGFSFETKPGKKAPKAAAGPPVRMHDGFECITPSEQPEDACLSGTAYW